MKKQRISFAAVGAVALLSLLGANPVYASIISTSFANVYIAHDDAPTISPDDTEATRTAFLGALSGTLTEDFSGFAAGSITAPFTIFSGSSNAATVSEVGAGALRIRDGSFGGRFATSGSIYLNARGNFTIEFSSPISAFGLFITDFSDFGQSGSLNFVFTNDTTNATANFGMDRSAENAALTFFGLIGKGGFSFNTIEFDNAVFNDVIGLDDIVIAAVAGDPGQGVAVPEPATLSLLSLGLLGLGLMLRRRRPAATPSLR